MKRDCPFVRISTFDITELFQSTNNLFGKVPWVHEPTSGQDIQDATPCVIEKRSDYRLPVIIRRPPKFFHFLPRRYPQYFVMGLTEHARLMTIPQEVEVGGRMTFQRL
jgi:hypothetical protein